MASPEDGFVEAERRIAACRDTGAQVLDLGGLQLRAVPDGVQDLTWLKVLYLGGDAGIRKSPHLRRRDGGQKRCNALGALPDALFDALAQLEGLDLAFNSLSALPSSVAGLTGLTSLDLPFNRIGAAGAAHLAGLTRLTSLNLALNEIGPEGAAHLAGLKSLTSLDLTYNGIGDAGAAHLAGLTRLTSLNLWGNKIGDAGAAHLTGLTRLTSLDLIDNGIGAAGAAHLAGLTRLTSLNLALNEIGDAGAAHLAGLTGLTNLDLVGNKIGDEGAAHLAGLTRLTSLNLALNEIGDAGAAHLAGLTGLTSLNLVGNKIGDEGAAHLAGLTGLTNLDLTGNEIGAAGVAHLAGLTGLTSLDLSRNEIGDAGAAHLAGLKSLTSLDLTYNGIGTVAPFMGMDRLESIYLSKCTIRDPSPAFWRKPSLRRVDLEDARLGDVPPELLGRDCSHRLRAYFDGLDRGTPVDLRDVKVMILGNGQIGKTQLRRKLCGEEYDETVRTTHGIEIAETTLTVRVETDPVPLKIWDFGGQDIYLGTHALFMRSRAIFPVLWTPKSENNETHVVEGFVSQNFPLDYWVRYVKEMGGDRSPLLLVQAQCDVPELRRDPPVDQALRHAFVFPPPSIAFSAKDGVGEASLTEALGEAIGFLRRQRGLVTIGGGWAGVKTALEALRMKDQARDTGARKHRTLSMAAFLKICRDSGDIQNRGEARVLLNYLHDLGTVFYKDGHFNDQIILDQQWALDAIYAVFNRETGLYAAITDANGRFQQSTLSRLLWKDQFTDKEQASLIHMMQACDICFTLREESTAFGEALYVAPDLLKPRDEFDERTHPWDDDEGISTARYRFDLLPKGLMRSVMASVGKRVGQHAHYWQDGLYFRDGTTGARARVEAQFDDPKGWTGEIVVQTRDGRAVELLDTLSEMVDRACRRMGIKPASIERPTLEDGRHPQPRHEFRDERDGVKENPARALTPDLSVPGREECFISYAHGDDANCPRQQAFENVIRRLSIVGLEPVFDEDKVGYGESISAFMQKAVGSSKSVIILSEKYLKSPFCMYELVALYRICGSDLAAFRKRTRIIALPDVSVDKVKDWLSWQGYWKKEFNDLNDLLKTCAPAEVPKRAHTELTQIREFYLLTGDLLAAVADTRHYRGLGEIEKLSF